MDIKFTPYDINSSESISGVKGDKTEDPRIDAIDELQDAVEDDFDYVISGIERLVRKGMLDEAGNLLATLSETLDSAITIIGNEFESSKEE